MNSLDVFLTVAMGGATLSMYLTAQAPRTLNPNPTAGKQENAAHESGTAIARDAAPIYILDFKPRPAIPQIEASPLISLPILCTSEGTPFITVPVPPRYTDQTIYSLDPKNPRKYSYRDVPGIYDVHFLSFFPSEEAVYVLVNATRDSKQSEYSVLSQSGQTLGRGTGFRGEHSDFILKFDRSGSYQGAIELPAELRFHRIAELADGRFVAVAYDPSNAVARVVILKSDGTIDRNLSIPAEMEQNPELQRGTSGSVVGRAIAETSLSRWMFAPSRGNILLYTAHANFPVLEIGAGGATREVPVAAPQGYYLAGVIPSSGRWLFRYSRKTLPAAGESDTRPETRNYILYEVDPHDGHIKWELDPGAGPSFGIACEHDGVLTGFSLGPDSTYLPFTADAPK